MFHGYRRTSLTLPFFFSRADLLHTREARSILTATFTRISCQRKTSRAPIGCSFTRAAFPEKVIDRTGFGGFASTGRCWLCDNSIAFCRLREGGCNVRRARNVRSKCKFSKRRLSRTHTPCQHHGHGPGVILISRKFLFIES